MIDRVLVRQVIFFFGERALRGSVRLWYVLSLRFLIKHIDSDRDRNHKRPLLPFNVYLRADDLFVFKQS